MTITPRRLHAWIEPRNYGWAVMYGGTTVGRHRAKYRAQEQADALNEHEEPELEELEES